MTLQVEELQKIRKILEQAWTDGTAYYTPEYDELVKDHPRSLGQCYVTARALHHVFGWEILYNGEDGNNHYWNRLPCGLEVDFTSDQLGGDGIFPRHDMFGKPRCFKPLKECKSINPRLKLFLSRVEPALTELKRQLLLDPVINLKC